MGRNDLIHPAMVEILGVHPSLCTIKPLTENVVSGEVTKTPGTALHTDIPCAVSVQGGFMAGGRETDRGDGTYTRIEKMISLDRYLPDITEEHQAIVDGVTYDIEVVDHDSQHAYTRLGVSLTR